MGLNSARLDIDERRVATLSGLIVGAKRHDDVLELLRRRPDIKAVLDRSMVRPDSAELKALVETKLRSDGFDGYEIAVDEQLNVKIAGQTDSQGQTDSLLATVKTIDHVKSVSSDIRLSRSWLQTALQNFLNAKKWDFIRGFVTDENTILLLGAVGNAAQRGFIEQEIRTQFPDAVVRSELGIWKSIPARRRSDKKRASPQEPVQVTR